MRIGVFTSNQPRHIALVEQLAGISDEVYAVVEVSTLFPGLVQDFWGSNPTFAEYFKRVQQAEATVFGTPRFLPANTRAFSMRMADLSSLPLEAFDTVLGCDHLVVFGASFIKGPLAEALVARKAVNIHMGLSPYYRGNSTNFWPLFEGRPEYVGATIHRLTTGLDSGPILFHAVPPPQPYEKFELGMAAVASAHRALCRSIASGTIASIDPLPQDRSLELRYSKKAEFTEAVARQFLDSPITAEFIGARLKAADRSILLRVQM